MGLKKNSGWETLLYSMMSRSYVVIEPNKGKYWEASYRCAVSIGGGKQDVVRKETAGFTAVMLTNLDCVSKDLQPSLQAFTVPHSGGSREAKNRQKKRKEGNKS